MNFKIIGIAFIFITAILFYSLRLSVVFLHYAVFNENFTEMYCINKDKPEMECNGKCHLMQETQENVPEQKGLILNESLHQNIQLFFSPKQELISKKQDLSIFKKDNFSYHNHYDYQFHGNIFRPPNV